LQTVMRALGVALVATLVATLVSSPTVAATPEARAQSLRDAKAACRKASDLKNAASLGEPVVFGDASGKTAVLVTGVWRPAHMKNARATMLCLYDRASGTTEVEEVRRWAAPKEQTRPAPHG